MQLNISFEQVYNGLKKDISYTRVIDINPQTREMKEGTEQVLVEVPGGIHSGQYIKYTGKGHVGRNGGPAGDLYVKIYMKPSQQYDRDGDNIVVFVDVSVVDIVL